MIFMRANVKLVMSRRIYVINHGELSGIYFVAQFRYSKTRLFRFPIHIAKEILHLMLNSSSIVSFFIASLYQVPLKSCKWNCKMKN